MENKMMEILSEMNKTMLEMKQEIQETNKRFDGMENRLERIEIKLDGIGGQFEETTKHKQESESKQVVDINYLLHKIHQHDKEIFVINNKQ